MLLFVTPIRALLIILSFIVSIIPKFTEDVWTDILFGDKSTAPKTTVKPGKKKSQDGEGFVKGSNGVVTVVKYVYVENILFRY